MKTLFKIIVRFIFGAPINGRMRTNNTFFHKGTQDLTRHQRTHKWGYRSHLERAAYRWLWTSIVVLTCWGFHYDFDAALIWSLKIATVVVIVATMASYVYIVNWNHRRTIHKPIVHNLRRALPYSPTESGFLTIPRDFRENRDMRITVKLPKDFDGDSDVSARIKRIITRKTGVELIPEYNLVGKPTVTFKHAPAAPSVVNFETCKTHINSADPGKLFLGISNMNRPVYADIDGESPHLAIGMGTGGGKSTLIRLLIFGLLRQGVERIDILDVKMVSQNWARNVPGIYIHNDLDDIEKTIHDFSAQMQLRYQQLKDDADKTFRRRVLIIEEQNSLIDYIRNNYANKRTRSQPSTPPAIQDLSFIIFQGRQAMMNVFSVLQSISAKGMGGGDIRSNYNLFILSRASRGMWKMIWDEHKPRTKRHTGAAHMVTGTDLTELQLGFISEGEAVKEWPAFRSPDWNVDSPILDPVKEIERFTLKQLSEMEVLPISYASLRGYKSRDKSFPDDYGTKTYSVDDIVEWWNSRNSVKEISA